MVALCLFLELCEKRDILRLWQGNPHKLTRSKVFQDLLNEACLSNEFLAKKHRELIEHNAYLSVVNSKTQLAVLDLAYKVKGLYKHSNSYDSKLNHQLTTGEWEEIDKVNKSHSK